MDINITAIERNIRFYGPPVALVLFSLLVALITRSSPAPAGFALILAPIASWVNTGALITAAGGTLWLLWRGWIEWRWERGEYEGGCDHCGGPVSHLDGRYGTYSKCKMCGATQKGWR